jgi:glycosyltransferase involved in cell wall biosynthesis
MHVLIIPSWYPDYSKDINGVFFREQALALRKNGCQVGVIYPKLRSLRNWRTVLDGGGIVYENDDGVETYRSYGVQWFISMPSGFKRLWVYHGLKLFKKYIKAHGMPDIVHVHSMLYAGLLACELKLLYGVPFVITEHSTEYARQLINPVDLLLARNIARNAAANFAVSTCFSNLLDELVPCSHPWRVLPNIVSQIFLDYPLKQKASHQSFNFINIAMMSDKKKQKNILIAFAKVFGNSENITLTIGGDGPEMPQLKELSRTLGVSDRVCLPGSLSRQQVLDLMVVSDAFVLSSQYETFGVVVIEALALGLPVIATRCGGPESIVRDEDGLLIPIEDISSLAIAMKTIYDNRLKYNAEEIRTACSDRYSEKSVAEQLKTIYAEIVGEKCN